MLETTTPVPDWDAYARRDLIFPKLTQEMVDRSLPYGTIEEYTAGATIYSRGVRGVDFFIVLIHKRTSSFGEVPPAARERAPGPLHLCRAIRRRQGCC